MDGFHYKGAVFFFSVTNINNNGNLREQNP